MGLYRIGFLWGWETGIGTLETMGRVSVCWRAGPTFIKRARHPVHELDDPANL
jgi:hypothetical protein